MISGLLGFLLEKRYPFLDFFSAVQTVEQQRTFSEVYGPEFLLEYDYLTKESRRLNRAIAVAAFISNDGDPNSQNFLNAVERMTEEEWDLAIRHSPYHKKKNALKGLELNFDALKNEVLDLHSIAARMASAARVSGWDSVEYKLAQRQAAGTLLSISSLHAAFIDTSRTLREKEFGKNSRADRAIKRIFEPLAAKHSFLKDLRNCLLHYSIQTPEVRIFYGVEDERYEFYLKGQSLLGSGYDWKKDTRLFLSSQKNGEVKVLDLTRSIIANIEKQVEFHFRCIERASREEKLSYESYLAIRQGVVSSQSERINRAFRTHGTWRKTQKTQ